MLHIQIKNHTNYMRHPTTSYLACVFNTLFNMRALGILIWFSLIPSFCIAQDDIADKKSSIVVGGDLLWNSKHRLKEDSKYKQINISSSVKFGYFFSDNDLLLLRPRISMEFASFKPDGPNSNEIIFGGELVYRRFFGNSIFGGGVVGGDWEREFASNYVSGEPQYDKEVYAGLELGYVYFLNPRVGIESAVYYTARRKIVIRDVFSGQQNYSKAGIHIGLIYLFKLKTRNNE